MSLIRKKDTCINNLYGVVCIVLYQQFIWSGITFWLLKYPMELSDCRSIENWILLKRALSTIVSATIQYCGRSILSIIEISQYHLWEDIGWLQMLFVTLETYRALVLGFMRSSACSVALYPGIRITWVRHRVERTFAALRAWCHTLWGGCLSLWMYMYFRWYSSQPFRSQNVQPLILNQGWLPSVEPDCFGS